MAKVEELEGEVVSLWEDIVEARGFERVFGRIICILLLEGKPISQKQISEKTGYSLPSVSKALNTLTSLGSVRKIRGSGARTMLYFVEMHPSEMMSGGLVKWILTAKAMERRVTQIQSRLGEYRAEDPERVERLKETLSKLGSSLPKMIQVIEKAVDELRRAVG